MVVQHHLANFGNVSSVVAVFRHPERSFSPKVFHKGFDPLAQLFYDLEREVLYSIKWHKNNVEFYRYLPADNPPEQKYELPGIFLDLGWCKEGYIFMYKTDVHSEGTYRCEVSTEAPFFRTVKGESEMRIYGTYNVAKIF
ncbi:hypothetical protein HNY73_002683 [Argiope bruennichi]|uniref:Ig-like domain-containing protein n=1 Tax=Argiope bruennichi TaxID=94029 RepID=A0A8T0FUG8_ARGBR|nr:hypothetical protein HNY73_002683 [Argiope bruennichi]